MEGSLSIVPFCPFCLRTIRHFNIQLVTVTRWKKKVVAGHSMKQKGIDLSESYLFLSAREVILETCTQKKPYGWVPSVHLSIVFAWETFFKRVGNTLCKGNFYIKAFFDKHYCLDLCWQHVAIGCKVTDYRVWFYGESSPTLDFVHTAQHWISFIKPNNGFCLCNTTLDIVHTAQH